MWKIAIPAICVLAHLYVVMLFLPSFWREVDERGFGWHMVVSIFVIPLGAVAMIANYLFGHLASLPTWLMVMGFITIDALVVGMVLAAVALYRRRKRTT